MVIADARGTGASFGSRTAEWDDNEVADGADLVDWIIDQPWSDGRVATEGVSYEGGTAEHLLRNAHPAVRAAAIRYIAFDTYADVFAVGGIRSNWFMETWSALNAAKDANRQEGFLRAHGGGLMKVVGLLGDGVAPVDGPDGERLLADALVDHRRNYDLVATATDVECRDDPRADGQLLDDFSPHTHLADIRDGAPRVLSWSSWWDGAYPLAAVKRWAALQDLGAHLVLGPWDHGNRTVPDPDLELDKPEFDHVGHMQRFFEAAFDGRSPDPDPVHYFTTGENRWQSAPTWPPPGGGTRPLFLDRGGRLQPDPDPAPSTSTYRIDRRATTGNAGRWVTQANIWARPISYDDRAEQDRRLLVFDSAVLGRDVEVTGHPVLELHLAADASDTAVHAYLEQVRPDGTVRYVTEGQLRASHRRTRDDQAPEWDRFQPCRTHRREDRQELVPGEVVELRFGLQPISHLFCAGSRIRLALAGADADNFVPVPADGRDVTWTVHHGRPTPSCIELPWRER